VHPLRPLCLCGEITVRQIHHRDTENTEGAQRKLNLGHYPASLYLYKLFINPLRHPYEPGRNMQALIICLPKSRMDKTYTLHEDDSGDVLYQRIFLLIGKNRWAWQSLGAALGLAGGMLSILLGSLLWIVVRFLATARLGSYLNAIEILFFALTLPLLALGAYCLDLLEKKCTLLPSPSMSPLVNLDLRHYPRSKRPHNN
jgi:hypothetical protein